MNARLSLADIAAHCATTLPAGTKVGTGYRRDYLTALGKGPYPQVWIGAQRFTKISQGDDFSGIHRVHGKADIAVRIIVQRYIDGESDCEARLNAFCDACANALYGFALPGADSPLTIESSQDGPPSESVVVVDIIFSTLVTYARAA